MGIFPWLPLSSNPLSPEPRNTPLQRERSVLHGACLTDTCILLYQYGWLHIRIDIYWLSMFTGCPCRHITIQLLLCLVLCPAAIGKGIWWHFWLYWVSLTEKGDDQSDLSFIISHMTVYTCKYRHLVLCASCHVTKIQSHKLSCVFMDLILGAPAVVT